MRRLMFIALSVIALGLGTACSKKTQKNDPGGSGLPIGPGPDPGGNQNPGAVNWSTGATAQLVLDPSSAQTFQKFADIMNFTTNNVSAVYFNLDVSNVNTTGSDDLYAGHLRIGYYDDINGNNYYYEADANASGDTYSAQYNHWVQHGPDDYVKMFFEFTHGALIFVGHVSNDLGEMSGRVYYKEHDYDRCALPGTWPWIGCGAPPITIPQNPPRHCWTIYYYSGTYGYNVYDCRNYLQGSGSNAYVNTSSTVWPETGGHHDYELLGTFTNLIKDDAGIGNP